MLRPCTKEEFDRLSGFAYGLASDPARSGYPTYCDGVKTKEMFLERSAKAFERETERMLLFELEGEVQGIVHFYWIPEDLYVGTNLFLTAKETGLALSEFIAYAKKTFPGYDLFLGFPEDNAQAADFLAGRGYECIESDYNNTSFLDSFGPFPENSRAVLIGRENYELFQALHSRTEGDMYWNSDRICGDLDHWRIFVREENGKALGAVYYMDEKDGWLEIFGIDVDGDARDEELYGDLLLAALSDARRRNGKVMTFFCEEEYESVALACGFKCVGKYLCFRVRLD